jgi:hypothetical protein
MKFKIGNKVQFTGYFEPGVTDFGIVGRHHYKKSKRLVIRGKMVGFTKCFFEVYLTDVKNYGLKKFKRTA